MIKPLSKEGKKIKETLNSILKEAMESTRCLATDLVHLEQPKTGLQELVQHFINRIKYIAQFSVELDFENNALVSQLENPQKICLYRIIQELLNNILKYSKAKHAWIRLCTDTGNI